MTPAVIRRCVRADLRALEWSAKLRADRGLIESVFEATRDGVGAMLVAEHDGELVGQVWVDVTRKPGIAVLWALRVKRSWRGRGVGSLLIARGEREGSLQGARVAEIAVEPDNDRARALYGRLGYRFVGCEPATDALDSGELGFELEIMRRLLAGGRADLRR